MQLNRTYYSLLLLLVMLAACNQAGGSQKYTISGKISEPAEKTLYLEKLDLTAITLIDSAKVDDAGNFKLSGQAELGFYRLRSGAQQQWIFLLENAGYTMELSGAKPGDYKIKGPASNDEFQEVAMGLSRMQQDLQMLNNTFNMARYSGMGQDTVNMIAQQLEATGARLEDFAKTRAAQAKHPLVALYATSFLKTERFPVETKKTLDRLEKELPNTSYLADFRKNYQQYEEQRKVQEMQQRAQSATAVGAQAPEISLPDPSGKTRSLSSLRGKVVLIDFWASWCGPCRRENPNVVKAYAKYHGKGFEIFSVSLDKDMGAWKNAISADGLSWPDHVSDLKGWGSAAAAAYGVNGIPATFLLDQNGVIVEKNLRGPALEAKLQELLK